MNTFLPRFLSESFFCTRKEENAELNAKNDYLDPGRLRDLQRSVVMSRARPSSTRITRSVNGRVFCNARLSRRRLLVCTWILYRDKNLFAFSPLERLRGFFIFSLFSSHANARERWACYDYAPRYTLVWRSSTLWERDIVHQPRTFTSACATIRTYVRMYARPPLPAFAFSHRSEISFHREKKRGRQLCPRCYASRHFILRTT